MSFFGALDVEAARIEAHALADDRHARILLAAPADLEQARLPCRRAAHGMDGGKVRGEELIAHPLVEFAAEELGLLAHDVGELFRPHVLGGRVHQVAHHPHGLRHVERFLHARGAFHLELGGGALRLLVARELVGAQVPREGGLVGGHGDRALAERVAPVRQLERKRREGP
jgi:hypothetical protein